MLKFVVLCAFVAVAAAEPGAVFAATPLAAPVTYSSSYLTPATAAIASTGVYGSPYVYSAPWGGYSHFIKKRSAPLALAGSYYTPSSYIASAPLTATTYASPVIGAAPYWASPLGYSAPAHFIKKRSAPLALASPYLASATYAATAPLLTSTYATAPVVSASPYISTVPFGYSHFIKKRSAPLIASSYLAPTSYSTQSRIDVQHSAPAFTTTYTAPLAYASPFGYPYYKK